MKSAGLHKAAIWATMLARESVIAETGLRRTTEQTWPGACLLGFLALQERRANVDSA